MLSLHHVIMIFISLYILHTAWGWNRCKQSGHSCAGTTKLQFVIHHERIAVILLSLIWAFHLFLGPRSTLLNVNLLNDLWTKS